MTGCKKIIFLESKVDEVSGTDDTIKFEEDKEYKTFSDKFGVGK